MGAGARASLSHYEPRPATATRRTWPAQLKASPVRAQWDPERSLRLEALPYRSLQVGLSGEAVDRYVDDWIVGLDDVTGLAHRIRDLLRAGDRATAESLLPTETPYPLPAAIGTRIDAT